jgi:hypothetical protein
VAVSEVPGWTPEQLAMAARAAKESDEAMQRAAQMRPDPSATEWLVDLPPYDAEGVVIARFVITEAEANIDKLRAAFNPQRGDRSIDAGTFTRLTVDGLIWMTDTPAEVRDHLEADWAMGLVHGGSALIVGLGMGMVLNRAIRKHRMSRIDVVEIDPRIIKAVAPHYERLAHDHDIELFIHQADIHEWRPQRGLFWDMAWFDIWPTINDEDMPEVKRLRDRFRTRVGWSGAWAQDERIAMKRRIASGRWAY